MTFLFTDIEGSTQRWARNRIAMQDAVRRHDRLMREAIAAEGGYIFKTIGDAFCAAFATPESAARAALGAQTALAAADFSAVEGLRVRMAINTGTADERDGDYFGPTLNRVARLLVLGYGGQILLSGVAADLVRGNPPPQAELTDLGAHALKDLEGHERVYQLAAPGLQRDFPELAQKASAPWLVPDAMRTRYFTGREELLGRLRRQLVERHRAALSGLGGVGKTQAAIEYAARHRAAYPTGVFWVNAETVGGLTSGFVAIAAALQLSASRSDDHDRAVRAVLEWLNENAGWLLILDNVDDRRGVTEFVPAPGAGDVLITSRDRVFAEVGIPHALEVRDLELEEGVSFLLARTGREAPDPEERASAGELAVELGNLPLALEQAAAYITETDASFADYHRAFLKRRVSLLEKAEGLVAHDSVAVTWAANFEAVERGSAASADILRIGALLAPDMIPFEIFTDGARALGGAVAQALADADELTIGELLRPLTRYSLVRSDAASRVFGMHRLVQEIVWMALAQSERRSYVERAVRALDAVLPEVEFAAWPRCERLVAHVASIADRAESESAPPHATGRVLHRTGWYLRVRGRFGEAQPLHERALAIRQRAFGSDHPDVAVSVHDLAVLHVDQGRYAEARGLYERALAIWERTRGLDHLDVARTFNGLAIVHHNEGRFAEAQALHERVLEIRERILGPDHRDVALTVNNLGAVVWEQGRYAEAQALHERALAMQERLLGPDHPDVAHFLNDLALALRDQGRHAQARALHERALAIWERALGPDHPVVAEGLDGLASVYAALGRHDEAEPLFERALQIQERAYGPDHPDSAQTLVGMASLRKDQGRSAEAVHLYERALAIKSQAFGADHPRLAEIRKNIDALRGSTARRSTIR